MKHDELVERAVRWLRNTRRCPVILQEPLCQVQPQSPDAIGWTPRGWSIAVECKTSVADFEADKRKAYRRMHLPPVGQERWYMAPAGVIPVDKVPEGWGLLELHGRIVKRIVEPEWEPWSIEQMKTDAPLLVKAAREALHQRTGSVYRAEASAAKDDAA